uniref:Uncharacterized protein n=1 Tax=Candidatus Kentrum sp. LPFa TaxID=2126335 RepID=A0A450VTY7_9GAMM|nr:MAG: hypothetical protein BECKLPF1236A_GA0070988_100156 [Candidatus Kentron sp. LPFa]VFK24064.1 MAG: hypothetical protein BECKLPF1236C_GA0070990_100108 [Candidatus Kentron sp. LPFa]
MPSRDHDFVELRRRFVPVGKDEEPNLEVYHFWDLEDDKLLHWPDLLRHRRVVLLAEAASGKTWEFRHRAGELANQGKPAFFVTIDALAGKGFERTQKSSDAKIFASWRDGGMSEPAWFFLDSADEARLLQYKALEDALIEFDRELGPDGIARAHVYLSCRVSDWKTREDRATFQRLLPAPELPKPSPSEDSWEDKDAALLDPLFPPENETRQTPAPEEEPKTDPEELLLVQLVPLDREQRRKLAEAWGIENPDAFLGEIERNGLDKLAERPGDMADLAVYWKEHQCFGSRARMVEYGITRKLAERDKFRPDNEALSSEKARRGAERLAAALTLGKSFTLLATGQEADPELAAGAMDPAEVLPKWTDAERGALLRRGVFAPSTYGRVRFHHRGTQEYLTARWLHGLLEKGAPREAVWDLLFAERYGVETLVPSLRGIAAWIALWRDDIRDEIIRREPLVLLGESGDPRSLPLVAKEQLLKSYARRHLAGEIADDRTDHRAVWLFSEPGLADAIRECWGINDRKSFRIVLLRMAVEGKIRDCVGLARDTILDATGEVRYVAKMFALDALNACNDAEGLAEATRWLMAAESPEHRLLFHFAGILYPRHISVKKLLILLDRHPLTEKNSFIHTISETLAGCWDTALEDRERLLTGLGRLCLAPPFVDERHDRISARHRALAKKLESLGVKAVSALGNAEPSPGLVRLLMAIERADRRERTSREGPSLAELVSANPRLKRALLWADVAEARENGRKREDVTRFWDVDHSFWESTLWRFAPDDLDWLYQDLATRPLVEDKQVALSATQAILRSEEKLHGEADQLRQRIGGDAALLADLDWYLAPPKEDERVIRWRQEKSERKREREKEERQQKEFWLAFREELQANPGILSDRELLSDWGRGFFRLHDLATWLGHRVGGNDTGPIQWCLLEEGFGRQVAEGYRDGMKILWQITLPKRPIYHKDGGITSEYVTDLSLAGLEIEAGEDPDWASRLSEVEAERAIQHTCLSAYSYPNWLDDFVAQHPVVALPILEKRLTEEWRGRHGNYAPFLSHHHHSNRPIPALFRRLLLELLSGKAPKHGKAMDDILAIIPRLELNEAERKRIARLARRRLRAAQKADNDETALRNLALLFLTNATGATEELVHWLDGMSDSAPLASRNERAETCLGRLFDQHHHHSLARGVLDDAPVLCLEKLVQLVYRHVRREDDEKHEGVHTPNVRDYAQDARNAILTALLDRPGPEAYVAIRRLASNKSLFDEDFSTWLSEHAHARAEKDAEPLPWTPPQVLDFEREYILPVQSGDDLLKVVMNVLSDIQSGFARDDASSRVLLQRAENEGEVQEWLAEQMSLRVKGRYHAHRETEVSQRNRTDIIVSSTAAKVEVVIEIKHGGKDWSGADLKAALEKQLTGKYLNPRERRHGILLITHHGKKGWQHPDTRKRLGFGGLIEYLQKIADSTEKNRYGPVQVRVFGLDASGAKPT